MNVVIIRAGPTFTVGRDFVDAATGKTVAHGTFTVNENAHTYHWNTTVSEGIARLALFIKSGEDGMSIQKFTTT